ncbi:MAG: RNA 2'-phosphotransferase, partial [bacterium]|nr:RNA 2'-phosphotransferase [bacterium]
MRVTDLGVPAELCTASRVDVSGQWALQVSHRAVWLLRHGALERNLPMDDGGWVLLRHLATRVQVEPGVLIMIAATDDKGRFPLAHYAPGGRPASTVLIRAKQGHSIAGLRDERLYVSPSVPKMHEIPVLRHSTTFGPLHAILRDGIMPGGGVSAPTRPGGGRRRQVHFVPFPVGDDRVVSGARDHADVHIYCNKWALYTQIPLWLSSSMAVLTTDEVPWDSIELVVFTKGALRRTMYDAAFAAYPLDEMSPEALRYAKGRHRERKASASRTHGLTGEARPRAPRASGTQGSTGDSPTAGLGDPMSGDEDVVGSISQERLEEQPKRLREFERQQEGRASQSTRVGVWRANYADDPDDPCCEEAEPSSAAHGGTAGRGRPWQRSSGALASTAAPRESPSSPAHG